MDAAGPDRDKTLFGAVQYLTPAVVPNGYDVLDADAQPAGQVDARLGRDHRPGGQGLVMPRRRRMALWALM